MAVEDDVKAVNQVDKYQKISIPVISLIYSANAADKSHKNIFTGGIINVGVSSCGIHNLSFEKQQEIKSKQGKTNFC